MSVGAAPERVLLPRWRLFHNANNFDELNQVSSRVLVADDRIEHINAIEEWRANNNIENAVELCSSAVVNGYFDDAKESALFILDTQPLSKSVIAMAEKVLNPDREIENTALDDRQSRIANIRKKTHRSPANPILWADMALLYSSQGQNEKAERAIKNALILAPHNRFIVRCAARFFMHVNKTAEARHAVENYRFLKQDPWILATELSISSKQNRTSKYLKLSKTVIEKNRISEFHGSELASALGLVELSCGANRKAVKLFQYSLRTPAGNSIAQAQWIENHHKLRILLQDDIVSKDPTHEAECYQFYKSGDWENSMQSAKQWAEYEPYSTQSFLYMSYVSLVCQDDIDKCIANNVKGLKLRKDEFWFLNSLVVAYAQKGNLKEAEKICALIKRQNLRKMERIVYTATNGMLEFKNRNISEGRRLYNEAIMQLKVLKYGKRSENLALLFLAREEILSKTDKAHRFFRDIQDKMKLEEDKDILAFKENVEKLLSNRIRNDK